MSSLQIIENDINVVRDQHNERPDSRPTFHSASSSSLSSTLLDELDSDIVHFILNNTGLEAPSHSLWGFLQNAASAPPTLVETPDAEQIESNRRPYCRCALMPSSDPPSKRRKINRKRIRNTIREILKDHGK